MKYLLSLLVIIFLYYWIKNREKFYPPLLVIIFPLLIIFIGLMTKTVGAFFWAIITSLIWWGVTYYYKKEKKWEILFLFNTYFCFLFLAGLIIIGPLIGIFIVPKVILDHPEPNLYFYYLFRTGVIAGLILGTLGGTLSIPNKPNNQKDP